MEDEERVTDSTADLEPQEETQEDPNKLNSEETSEDNPTASSETEETPTDEEPASDEAPKEESAEEEEADLDDETLEALAEAYGPRLRKTKSLGGDVTRSIKDEVSRQVREHVSTVDSQSTIDQLINQGQVASRKIGDLAKAAKEELGKASRNEEGFNPDVLDPQEIVKSLNEYGAATALYERHVLETATQEGFDQVFGDALPALSDDQNEELSGLVNTVARMRGDPRQQAKADNYWLSELLNFVAARGIEHGATQESTKVASKKTVRAKIAGTNAVKAAKASIEAGKGPPRTQKSEPRQVGVDYSEEGYQEIKKTNDPVKIQDYVNGWMRKRQKVAG